MWPVKVRSLFSSCALFISCRSQLIYDVPAAVVVAAMAIVFRAAAPSAAKTRGTVFLGIGFVRFIVLFHTLNTLSPYCSWRSSSSIVMLPPTRCTQRRTRISPASITCGTTRQRLLDCQIIKAALFFYSWHFSCTPATHAHFRVCRKSMAARNASMPPRICAARLSHCRWRLLWRRSAV